MCFHPSTSLIQTNAVTMNYTFVVDRGRLGNFLLCLAILYIEDMFMISFLKHMVFFFERVIVSVIVSELYKHYVSTCVAKTIALDLIVNPLL